MNSTSFKSHVLLLLLLCVFFLLGLFIDGGDFATANTFGDSSQENLEFFNRSISYEYNTVILQKREGTQLTDYFKSLEIPENEVYVLVIFKKNLTGAQKSELAQDGAKLVGLYGKTVYLFKFPKKILESKSYDFVEWMDVPRENSKIVSIKLLDN